MTAYFLWMNEEGRAEIKRDNPDLGVTEIAKTAGDKWKALDEDIKKKYEEKHKELKEKYEEEYKEWYESGGKEAMKNAKKEGKAGSSKSPKKKSKTVSAVPGGQVKSKEFIEDSDDSSDAGKDDDDAGDSD